MENNGCKMKGCLGKYLLSALLVFIFLFASEFVINHYILMPIYEETSSLWRSPVDIQHYFPFLILYYAVLALVISALYCKISKAKAEACANNPDAKCECPIQRGICFGGLIGILMGSMCAASYIFTPIPAKLAIGWFIARLWDGIGAGIILSLLCHKKKAAVQQ